MAAFTIEVQDSGVRDALNALASRVANTRPILQQIGEGIIERTKQRFASSTGPDGQRWAPNARATIEAFIANRRGLGKRGINTKGRTLAMNKKPLIARGDLSRSFRYQISGTDVLEVGTNWMASKINGGAAIHQFGGKAGKGKRTKIPARPFLPIRIDGSLYDSDRNTVLETLNRYISGG